MIAIDPTSPFFAPFKLTFFVSLCAAAPYILYQLWSFIAPGLYKNEKEIAIPLFVSSVVLFTGNGMPALYILKLDPHPLQTVLICLAGGCLGILFLIPLRRYFVRETHGEFPYPEATAALGLPLLGHLDPAFLQVMDDTCEDLRTVWGTRNSRTLPIRNRCISRSGQHSPARWLCGV
jgi:hypothetical protein